VRQESKELEQVSKEYVAAIYAVNHFAQRYAEGHQHDAPKCLYFEGRWWRVCRDCGLVFRFSPSRGRIVYRRSVLDL
jgi:hypothetical protein